MNKPTNYMTDMDGVLIKGKTIIPGADRFIGRLQELAIPYLVLTNNPLYTQRDLSHRLENIGLTVPPDRIFTSAMATASSSTRVSMSAAENSGTTRSLGVGSAVSLIRPSRPSAS